MLEKNYKLAEMIFLEQAMGEEGPDGEGDQGGELKQTQRKKEHWLAGLPKVWGELTEMFIPLVSLLNFLLCVSSYVTLFLPLHARACLYNYCAWRKIWILWGLKLIQCEEPCLRKTALDSWSGGSIGWSVIPYTNRSWV